MFLRDIQAKSGMVGNYASMESSHASQPYSYIKKIYMRAIFYQPQRKLSLFGLALENNCGNPSLAWELSTLTW